MGKILKTLEYTNPCGSIYFLLTCHERMQVIGGFVVIIGLPLISTSTQSASYVFTHFETSPEATGIHSKPYAIILSVLLSQYCLYGYDTAAHLTEETKGADRTGPMAILSCIGIISTFGWAYILVLTFCIQVYMISMKSWLLFQNFIRSTIKFDIRQCCYCRIQPIYLTQTMRQLVHLCLHK